MYLDELHDILTGYLDRLLCLAAGIMIGAAFLYGVSRLVPDVPASVEATVNETFRSAESLSAASRKAGTALAAAAVEGWKSADE